MAQIAVLGGGAGGHAVAADCSLAGHTVTWVELAQFAAALDPVKASRTIQVLGRGPDPLHAKIEQITTECGQAIPKADLIFIITPCFGHQPMSEACAPHLRDRQAVIFFGEGSGSLMLRRVMQEKGIRRDVLIGETNTLPYMARLRAPGRVLAARKAGGTMLAAYPGRRTPELLGRVKDLWPYLMPATNVLETTLINFNAIDHVATMVCNAGSLETRTTPCLLWGEGASPGVARAIEAVDHEILAIRAALGFADRTPYRDFLVKQGLLDAPQPTTYQAIQRSSLSASTFQCGPEALKFRYITEDVPYSLVLISEIGAVAGVGTPVIDGLIAISSALNGEDYRKAGRTLAKLGLGGLTRDALLRAVNDGV
jgi:opine dehydrogenase